MPNVADLKSLLPHSILQGHLFQQKRLSFSVSRWPFGSKETFSMWCFFWLQHHPQFNKYMNVIFDSLYFCVFIVSKEDIPIMDREVFKVEENDGEPSTSKVSACLWYICFFLSPLYTLCYVLYVRYSSGSTNLIFVVNFTSSDCKACCNRKASASSAGHGKNTTGTQWETWWQTVKTHAGGHFIRCIPILEIICSLKTYITE